MDVAVAVGPPGNQEAVRPACNIRIGGRSLVIDGKLRTDRRAAGIEAPPEDSYPGRTVIALPHDHRNTAGVGGHARPTLRAGRVRVHLKLGTERRATRVVDATGDAVGSTICRSSSTPDDHEAAVGAGGDG